MIRGLLTMDRTVQIIPQSFGVSTHFFDKQCLCLMFYPRSYADIKTIGDIRKGNPVSFLILRSTNSIFSIFLQI